MSTSTRYINDPTINLNSAEVTEMLDVLKYYAYLDYLKRMQPRRQTKKRRK